MRPRRARSRPRIATALVVALVAAACALAGAPGCGGKKPRDSDSGSGGGATTATRRTGTQDGGIPAGGSSPSPPAATSDEKTVSFDQATEYVRDFQGRLNRLQKRLDGIGQMVQATEARESPEMEARLDILRSLIADLDNRAIDAENSATADTWPVWQRSLDGTLAGLVRSTDQLDSMVTAVRKGP